VAIVRDGAASPVGLWDPRHVRDVIAAMSTFEQALVDTNR
jgi:hypothetical protein